jgi:Golgi nucleoside diphosphatase
MRVLDQLSRDQIMINVRLELSLSKFKFSSENARVISGEEEGVYGWLSVNYMRNTIFSNDDRVGLHHFIILTSYHMFTITEPVTTISAMLVNVHLMV